MPALELFHLPGACSRVTLAALELTGAPFSVVVPPLHRGGLNDPAYRAKNPFGKVPTLTIDGRALTENVAILATLHRLFPQAKLLPGGDAYIDGLALSRLAICASQLHPNVTRIVFPQRFCDASPEATVRVRELAIAMLTSLLGAIEKDLQGRDWWLGDEFSIADAYLVWITGRMPRIGVELPELPAIGAHAKRVAATAVWQRVLERDRGYLAALEADGAQFPEVFRISMSG